MNNGELETDIKLYSFLINLLKSNNKIRNKCYLYDVSSCTICIKYNAHLKANESF